MEWVLIFYISGWRSGGPATAAFATEAACRTAGEAILHKWPRDPGGSMTGFICVKSR